jgi:hypothetical protein
MPFGLSYSPSRPTQRAGASGGSPGCLLDALAAPAGVTDDAAGGCAQAAITADALATRRIFERVMVSNLRGAAGMP